MTRMIIHMDFVQNYKFVIKQETYNGFSNHIRNQRWNITSMASYVMQILK